MLLNPFVRGTPGPPYSWYPCPALILELEILLTTTFIRGASAFPSDLLYIRSTLAILLICVLFDPRLARCIFARPLFAVLPTPLICGAPGPLVCCALGPHRRSAPEPPSLLMVLPTTPV